LYLSTARNTVDGYLKKIGKSMRILNFFTMFLLLVVPTALNANGFRLVSQDAFAAGRGEAFVATADNPSAVHYNPAGITQLDGLQVRSGLYALHFEPTFTPPAGRANSGTTYEIEERDAFAPQLYSTYHIPESPLTLGLGIYAPHGASVTWPQDTGFRSIATIGELTYLRFNPVLAWEIRPGLSVAGGMMVDYAELDSEQGLRAEKFVNSRDSFAFKGDDLSVGYNLGVLWKIDDQFSFGLTYRSAVTQNFKGHTNFELGREIQPTELPASAELEFPYTAVAGLSYRPTEQWNIEINADYSNWSSMDSFEIRQTQLPQRPVQQNIPVSLGFEDSWIYKLGATRYFDEGWYASAGYVFNQNSVPDDFYSPTVADLDRHFLTFGIGREWSRFQVDLTYQFGFAKDREVTDSLPSSTPARFVGQNADGTYGFSSHALLISLGMKF
jgi:long-chain fatty acid transport protein